MEIETRWLSAFTISPAFRHITEVVVLAVNRISTTSICRIWNSI